MSSLEPNRSVTLWLEELRCGSDNAATELWRRYFQRLVALAKNQLRNAPKRIFDEEDIAINVFYSLCEGVEKGRFDQLDDRDDLWKLLVVMTRYKSNNELRFQSALKRGAGKVRGHSISDHFGFDQFFGDDPSPELLVQIREEQERMLEQLPEDSHRKVAQLRLQGYSVDETAQLMEISSRSVKRKLALIRETWLYELSNNT